MSIDIIQAQQAMAMQQQQAAQDLLAQQGIYPPPEEAAPGQEPGQPAPNFKEGNSAFTLNVHEGNKVSKK